MNYASLSLTIRKAYKDANFEEKDMLERIEEKIPVGGLTAGNAEIASVTSSVSTKVSDSVRYGDGTWDKIPFSVEVFASVTLNCGQTEKLIRAGHAMAYDLAWEASRGHMGKSLLGHVSDIQERLFAGNFE